VDGREQARRRDRLRGTPGRRAAGPLLELRSIQRPRYDCSNKPDYGWPIARATSCKTVFFVNRRTGRLGNFYTQSSRFSERHGVRIGMHTAKAERLLHRVVYVGCEENIHLGGQRGLTVAFTGGRAQKLQNAALRLTGGHVYAFALHGGRSELGVFDCL
jgi:hypothetical protein